MNNCSTSKSRTPILDSYTAVYVSVPESCSVRRFICPALRKIYINTAAHPDAKTDQLIPFRSKK